MHSSSSNPSSYPLSALSLGLALNCSHKEVLVSSMLKVSCFVKVEPIRVQAPTGCPTDSGWSSLQKTSQTWTCSLLPSSNVISMSVRKWSKNTVGPAVLHVRPLHSWSHNRCSNEHYCLTRLEALNDLESLKYTPLQDICKLMGNDGWCLCLNCRNLIAWQIAHSQCT